MDIEEMQKEDLLKMMAGSSRLDRKNAAKQISAQIKENPNDYVKHIPELIDALSRPEAQTRWECLNSLTRLVNLKPAACAKAIDDAELALFDEKTSLVRVSAIRFLCRYGAMSVQNSKEVWDIIKEGILRFHGEIEYDEMLNYVIYFSKGKISTKVKNELKGIAEEQIASVGGGTKMRLQMVLDAINPKKKKSAAKKKAAKKTSAKKTAAKKASKTSNKKTKKTAAKAPKKAKKQSDKKATKTATKKSSKKAAKKPVKNNKKQTKKSTKTKTAKKVKNSKKSK